MSNLDILANVPSSMAAVFPFVGSVVVFMLGAKNLTSPTQYAYAGEIIGILLSQMAAVYAASKTIDSGLGVLGFDWNTMTVKYNKNRFFYHYAGESDNGDTMGTTRIVNIFIFVALSATISILGYYGIYMMWEKFQNIERSGTAMTYVEGYKFLTLGLVCGLGAWAAGMTLGDNAVETFQWFYDYQVQVESNQFWDEAGTSLDRDFILHFVTLFFSTGSVFTIAFLAYYFGYSFL